MAAVLMQKHFGSLRPVDEAGEEVMRRLAVGDVVRVEVRRPRNLPHLRKFYALMNLIFANQERYQSLDEMVMAIKLAVGHVRLIQLPNGDVVRLPASIAFDALDQHGFDEFYERVVKLVCERIVPNLPEDELRAQLMEFAA